MTAARAAPDLAKAVKGSNTVTINGSGYNLMAETPDEVLDALIGFLQ